MKIYQVILGWIFHFGRNVCLEPSTIHMKILANRYVIQRVAQLFGSMNKIEYCNVGLAYEAAWEIAHDK